MTYSNLYRLNLTCCLMAMAFCIQERIVLEILFLIIGILLALISNEQKHTNNESRGYIWVSIIELVLLLYTQDIYMFLLGIGIYFIEKTWCLENIQIVKKNRFFVVLFICVITALSLLLHSNYGLTLTVISFFPMLMMEFAMRGQHRMLVKYTLLK